MKKTVAIVSFFLIVSCQFFEKEKTQNEKQLYEERLKEINWNTVDKLPTIGSCENIVEKDAQEKCFFDFFTRTINYKMDLDSLSKLYPNCKEMMVRVSVFPNEPLKFEAVINNLSVENKEKIDTLLKNKLDGFPLIGPAMKQGIPVKIQFLIPIKIKTQSNDTIKH